MSTTYRANVIRSGDDGIWVSIPSLGDAEFGPLEALASDKIILAKYEVNDRVLVQQVGAIPEDFIILGHAIRTQKTPPPWTGGGDDVEIDASQVVSGELSPLRIPGLDADKIITGELAEMLIPTLDADKIGSGRLGVDRLPYIGTRSSDNRVWLSTDPGADLATSNSLVLVPESDTSLTYGMYYAKDGSAVWAIDKDGKQLTGKVPATLVDKMISTATYTYLAGKEGSIGVGSENMALLVDAGANAIGGLYDGSYVWRFDSSGTLTSGTIPVARLSGRVPYMNHIAANANATPPYAIFGALPSVSYDSLATSLRLQNNSGTANGERFAIYDASRKVLMQANSDSAGDFMTIAAAYTRTTTTAANMVVFTTAGAVGRSTSLRSAKVAIEDAPDAWAESVWNLRPRTWFDRADAEVVAEAIDRSIDGEDIDWEQIVAAPLRRVPGFVAEEVVEAGLEEFVTRDSEGNLSGLAYDRMSAALLLAMKAERARTSRLEEELAVLTARLNTLEGSSDESS